MTHERFSRSKILEIHEINFVSWKEVLPFLSRGSRRSEIRVDFQGQESENDEIQ